MNKQEKIDRYLLNQMSKSDRKAFTQELKSDTDLADSLKTNQDIANFFAKENPELEDELEKLGDKYFSPHPPSAVATRKSYRLWLFPFFLLIGGVSIYFLAKETDETSEKVESPVEVKTNIAPTLPNIKEKERSPEINTTIKEHKKVQEEKKNPEFFPSPPEEKPEPIAALNPADFIVNPALESILQENIRSTETTNIINPHKQATLKASSDIFTCRGTTKSAPPYQLSIYSNRTFDFDNDLPTLRVVVTGESFEDGFAFDFKAKISFPTGLYYLILQNEAADLVGISKFKVE